MFFTTLFERTIFSALFSQSSSWKYRQCDGKKKEIKITSYTSAYTSIKVQQAFIHLHLFIPYVQQLCQSCLVPLPMKNKQVPKHSVRSHWNLFIAKLHKMAQSQRKLNIDNHYINLKLPIADPRQTSHPVGLFETNMDTPYRLLVYVSRGRMWWPTCIFLR